MTQQTSSMFLCDTTNVDHAYIDNEGRVVGGSYRPKFIVTGNVDPQENVVIDFSAVKKAIKASIDDYNTGFDHKLWWIEGTSAGTITFDGDNVTIDTPVVTITGPANIVKVIRSDEQIINDYVQVELCAKYPDVDARIETILTTTFDTPPQMNTAAHQFRYAHGLKMSSSFGCQNIAHGHLSYLGAKTTDVLATDLLLASIAAQLDGVVFAWDDNVSRENDQTVVDIGYTSAHRGRMQMSFKRSSVDRVKLVILETETTVEHLTEWIAAEWGDELRQAGVQQLFVSEGLSKGAVASLA